MCLCCVLFKSADGKVLVECRFELDTLWLSQAMICELYDKAKATISEHIYNIFSEGERLEDSVVRFYLRYSVSPMGNPNTSGIFS